MGEEGVHRGELKLTAAVIVCFNLPEYRAAQSLRDIINPRRFGRVVVGVFAKFTEYLHPESFVITTIAIELVDMRTFFPCDGSSKR